MRREEHILRIGMSGMDAGILEVESLDNFLCIDRMNR